mmetsp:Transcript_3028/g.6259  ORF Transcript_3028/g.6259 Transcript_3028/m.6259 type:complete len:546 (+) Transcript_3028:157-1794(+)
MQFMLLRLVLLSWCSFVVVNSQDTNTVEVNFECPNPCPWRFTGFILIPNTSCKSYAQCRNGNPIGEFQCFGNYIFAESKGGCDFASDGESECQPVPCPVPPTQSPTESPTISESPTMSESPSNTTPEPPRPTPFPTPVFFSFLSFVESRRQSIEATVLQSASGPSTAYTMEGLMSALDIVVNQFPSDKTFDVGEFSGLRYGVANFAAFLSQAMSEGIRMDSCDEWNTDYIFHDNTEKFPLSNACGQYKRAYDLEICKSTEPFECPIDRDMDVTAVDYNQNFMPGKTGPPALSCKPYDGSSFSGFYDLFDDVIVESAYSNSLGRTNVAGCCWWKRGALMTGGRCAFGKLNKYVGKEAADSRGIYVYPDIDFCSNPEAICDHIRTHELRWLIGFLDWSGRVETYVDAITGWSYMDELKKFVDSGMVDDAFITAVTNIVTKNCHNLDICADTWGEDPDKDYFELNRRVDFRNIMTNVLNLPETAPPTVTPKSIVPTFAPTVYIPPTPQPTSIPKTVVVLSPNSTSKCKYNMVVVLAPMVALATWCVWL